MVTLLEIYLLISFIIGAVVFRNVSSQPHRHRILRAVALGVAAIFAWPLIVREIVKWPQ